MVSFLSASTSIVPLSRAVIMSLMAQSPSTSRAKHAQACVHMHTIIVSSICWDSRTLPPPPLPPPSSLSTGLDSYSSSLLFPLLPFVSSSFCSRPLFDVEATLMNVSPLLHPTFPKPHGRNDVIDQQMLRKLLKEGERCKKCQCWYGCFIFNVPFMWLLAVFTGACRELKMDYFNQSACDTVLIYQGNKVRL